MRKTISCERCEYDWADRSGSGIDFCNTVLEQHFNVPPSANRMWVTATSKSSKYAVKAALDHFGWVYVDGVLRDLLFHTWEWIEWNVNNGRPYFYVEFEI